jgi:O-antigen ligase
MNPSLPSELESHEEERRHAHRSARHSSSPNRVLQWVLGMVIVIPILALPDNAPMQAVANRAIHVMTALLVGALILRARFPLRRENVLTFFRNATNLLLLLFLVSCVISVGVAPNLPGYRPLSILALMHLVTGALLYFALSSQVQRSDQLIRIGDTLVWVAGIMAVLGLATQSAQSDTVRVDVFGNAQLFGGFMMILFPVAAVFAFTEQDIKRKITAQISCILTFSGLIMSGVRSAWIGLGITLIALLLFSLIGASRQRIAQAFRLQFAIPLLTIAACFAYVFIEGDAVQMISKRLERGTDTLGTRQKFWHAARELYKQKPVFGVGLGMYPLMQSEYSGVGRPADAVLQTRPGLSEMAHNLWLRIAAEQGTLGVVTFSGVLLSFLVLGMRTLRDLAPSVRRSLLLASMGGIVGFSVDNFSNPAWEFPQIALYFWVLLGVGMACIRSHYERPPHSPR